MSTSTDELSNARHLIAAAARRRRITEVVSLGMWLLTFGASLGGWLAGRYLSPEQAASSRTALLVLLPLILVKVPLSARILRLHETAPYRSLTGLVVALDVAFVLGVLVAEPADNIPVLATALAVPVLTAGIRLGLRAALLACAGSYAGLAAVAVSRLWEVPTDELTLLRMGLTVAVLVGLITALLSGIQTDVAGRHQAALERLHDLLEHQATHDPLTGLGNRDALYTRAAALSGPGALLVVDLDGFKLVNDLHGHATGDTALRTVAERLRTVTGPDAAAIRVGGDEFVILLPGADRNSAAALAGRLEETISAPIPTATGPVTVGASVGVAQVPPEDRWNVDLLCAEADARMYEAKSDRKAVSRR